MMELAQVLHFLTPPLVMVLKVSYDPQVLKVEEDPQVMKVLKVLKVQEVQEDPQVTKVLKDPHPL